MSDTLPATAETAPPADPWTALRRHTPARIALGRCGNGMPTAEVLSLAAAHAQARDAVHLALDADALAQALQAAGFPSARVRSRAPTRDVYLRRPDLGRRLDDADVPRLSALTSRAGAPSPDLAVVLADGLSALAAQRHGLAVVTALRDALAGRLRWAPVVVATQARVALADEVGALLGARIVLILLGERPGLSSPDSLGAYLTFAPEVGRSDAQRNCVSNIRTAGLPPAAAAGRIAWLLQAALRLKLSGVGLKDDSAVELLPR